MEKLPISVVIITKNEEKRIEDCLRSVSWADEVIIVDDESTDQTINIAQKYSPKIIQRKMDIEGRHRNFAYSQAKNKWVLSLDADERVTEELKEEIYALWKDIDRCHGYCIPRKNFIGHKWLKYGGWYPSAQLRLFQKDKFRYEEVEVHPRAFMKDPRDYLKNPFIHYSYQNFSDYLNKLNKQTSLEAIKWYNAKKKVNFLTALRKATSRFLRTFLLKKGYKDGFEGLAVAFFAAFYQFLTYIKYWELKNNSQEAEIFRCAQDDNHI